MAAARSDASPPPRAVESMSSGGPESSAAALSWGLGATGDAERNRRDNGATKCMNRMEKMPLLNSRRHGVDTAEHIVKLSGLTVKPTAILPQALPRRAEVRALTIDFG